MPFYASVMGFAIFLFWKVSNTYKVERIPILVPSYQNSAFLSLPLCPFRKFAGVFQASSRYYYSLSYVNTTIKYQLIGVRSKYL